MILELVCFWILYYFFYHFYLKRRDLPPGPLPLPMMGNLSSFRNNQIENMVKKWHKKYGDIMTVWFGNMPVVTIHDAPTIQATFLKDGEAYSGRMRTNAQKLLIGYIGIGGTDGELWREHRRFALHVLRDFGLGKNLMQERILVEVTAMINNIKDDLKSGQKVVDIVAELDRAVGSIINALAFGYRFERGNTDEFFKNKEIIQKILANMTNVWWKMMENYASFMKYLPFFSGVYEKFKNERIDIAKFYLHQIEEHKKRINFDSDQEPTDFVEAFLRHQHKLNQSGVKNHTYTDDQLRGVVSDLWLAGQETTANTTCWLILHVLRHPECQVKIHEELDRIVGSDRIVTSDDKNNLHYLNAVIAESLRFSLGGFMVFHRTTKDVEIHGYKLPKDSAITYQLSTVFSDDRYFENPEKFQPERFLDKTGKFYNPLEFIPFGIGKRQCLGEGLARMELFLFVSNIFNQFKLKPENGKIPSDYRVHATTTRFLPYKCEFESRF